MNRQASQSADYESSDSSERSGLPVQFDEGEFERLDKLLRAQVKKELRTRYHGAKTLNGEDADDIANSAWMKALESEEFSSAKNRGAYLWVIARNHMFSSCRTERRRRELRSKRFALLLHLTTVIRADDVWDDIANELGSSQDLMTRSNLATARDMSLEHLEPFFEWLQERDIKKPLREKLVGTNVAIFDQMRDTFSPERLVGAADLLDALRMELSSQDFIFLILRGSHVPMHVVAAMLGTRRKHAMRRERELAEILRRRAAEMEDEVWD